MNRSSARRLAVPESRGAAHTRRLIVTGLVPRPRIPVGEEIHARMGVARKMGCPAAPAPPCPTPLQVPYQRSAVLIGTHTSANHQGPQTGRKRLTAVLPVPYLGRRRSGASAGVCDPAVRSTRASMVPIPRRPRRRRGDCLADDTVVAQPTRVPGSEASRGVRNPRAGS